MKPAELVCSKTHVDRTRVAGKNLCLLQDSAAPWFSWFTVWWMSRLNPSMDICCKNLFDGFCWYTENNQSNKSGMVALSFQKQYVSEKNMYHFLHWFMASKGCFPCLQLFTYTYIRFSKKKFKPKPKKKDCFKWHFKFILHVPCEQLTLSV